MEEKENDLVFLLHLLILWKACINAGLFFCEKAGILVVCIVSENRSKVIICHFEATAEKSLSITGHSNKISLFVRNDLYQREYLQQGVSFF